MKKQYVTLNLENINRVPVLQHNVSYSKSVWRVSYKLNKFTLIFIYENKKLLLIPLF